MFGTSVLVGDSSVGKSTLLEAARSVWGGPSFKRSWRATANGIEGAAGGPIIHNRAGWWVHGEVGRDYLFTAAGFAEAVAGFDKARAYDVLVELGAADPPGPDGKRQRFMRIDGRGVKVYRVRAERLGADL